MPETAIKQDRNIDEKQCWCGWAERGDKVERGKTLALGGEMG